MPCEASEGNVNGLPLNLSECLVFESLIFLGVHLYQIN